jgi:pimeloyl-ACP methyl ester carboxylesterase
MGAVLGALAMVACMGSANAADTGLAAGTLLTERPVEQAVQAPHAGRSATITYLSDDAHGHRITVSGMLYVPAGPPPAGGWPVISWGHGTTGVADACAPSADFAGGPAHDYIMLLTAMIDHWLSRGYAVAATDYEGLGTPGGHPYMNGTSEANTMEDIVTAARQWDHGIGPRWVAIGHSQGGAAALFGATQANHRTPKLKLIAAVAMAPGGLGLSQTMDFIKAHPDNRAALAFLPLILLGAQAAEPSLDVDSLLTPAGVDLLNIGRVQCVAALRAAVMATNGASIAIDADIAPLKRYLETQDIINARPKVPLMVVQGDQDALAPRMATDTVVSAICAGKAVPVDYHRYPDADHRGVLHAAETDIDRYLDAIFRGKEAPANTCPK